MVGRRDGWLVGAPRNCWEPLRPPMLPLPWAEGSAHLASWRQVQKLFIPFCFKKLGKDFKRKGEVLGVLMWGPHGWRIFHVSSWGRADKVCPAPNRTLVEDAVCPGVAAEAFLPLRCWAGLRHQPWSHFKAKLNLISGTNGKSSFIYCCVRLINSQKPWALVFLFTGIKWNSKWGLMGFPDHVPQTDFFPFNSQFWNQKDWEERGVLPVINRMGGILHSVLQLPTAPYNSKVAGKHLSL